MYEKDLTVLEGLRTNRYGDSIEGHVKPIVHQTHQLYTVGRMALDMASRWATVAAMPDGEDSNGRQKLRMQTPQELAQHACDVAQQLWREFEARGWFFEMPMPVADAKKQAAEA